MWIIIGVILMVLSYWFLIRPHKYWIRRGVVQGKPVFILGDNAGAILRSQTNAENIQMMYNISPNTRYCGVYQFLRPALLLRDPDLIKQITVKDFDHFVDHESFIPEDTDPLFGKNLFFLKGEKWRDTRSTISPAFTSSKMKYMFSLISESGQQSVNYFLKQDKDLIVVELKDTFTRFTTDVIANTAFGIECDSLGQPENEFYVRGQEATDFSDVWKFLKFFAYSIFPLISKITRVSQISEEAAMFFKKMVKENIVSREKHGILRTDLINLLMEARKHGHMKHEESHNIQDTGFATVQEPDVGKNKKTIKINITDEEITAHALIFFFGGLDSVSLLMCFMSYEIGVNPNIQKRLHQEVDKTREECNGKLTYEALASMKYMDMVISETLRKWPNAPGIDRICTKPYTIEPQTPNEKPVHLKKGDSVILPIYALHRDPQYFPDPDRFDPERFSDENKNNIKPYSYIPFGSGPRSCIGTRFALVETKILFFHILSHFEIVPVDKTRIPLQLSKKSMSMAAEGGFWFGLKKRVQ